MGKVYGKIAPPKELKPCPFCGGEGYIQTDYFKDIDMTSIAVMCLNCGASGKKVLVKGYHKSADIDIMETDIHAIKAWEQRREA